MSCCIRRVDGQDPATAATPVGFRTVYQRNLTDLGSVNLNAPDSSVVIDGVTWRTFGAATTGLDMAVAAGSFGLDAAGLTVVNATNSRCNAGSMTANFLYTSLADLAQNTVTPFAANPHANYIWQAHVSATNADQDTEWSGVCIFRVGSAFTASGGLGGDAATYRSGFGAGFALTEILLAGGGTTVAPTIIPYRAAGLVPPLPDPTVPHVHYANPQAIQGGGSPWLPGFADPGADYQAYVSGRDPTDVENDVVLHPVYGWLLGFGHCAETLANNLGASIDEVRLLQSPSPA